MCVNECAGAEEWPSTLFLTDITSFTFSNIITIVVSVVAVQMNCGLNALQLVVEDKGNRCVQ